MKTGRILKATWLAASVFILMLAMALPVSARDEWEKIGYAQVTTPAALRTKYNNQTASTIVKIVPKGSVIHVTKYMGNNWYKASYGSKSGYISGLFLTGEDDDDLSFSLDKLIESCRRNPRIILSLIEYLRSIIEDSSIEIKRIYLSERDEKGTLKSVFIQVNGIIGIYNGIDEINSMLCTIMREYI